MYVYGGVRFAHAVTFLSEQSRAREAQRGLWGPPCRGDTERAVPSVGRAAPDEPGPPARACDPSYAGACVPRTSSDLDCPDTGQPVRVIGADRHRLDGDGDGWSCEDW